LNLFKLFNRIYNALSLAYIAVQQTYFPYIRFIEKTDEKLKNISLPPLLIQPLIENASTHGLALKGTKGSTQ
jgi:sensor histidine kinase YesM